MSFEQICSGCGAPSGPSVGICPFCKTVMLSGNNANFPQEQSIRRHHQNGRLDLALAICKKTYSSDPSAKSDPNFLFLFGKILIEAEGPMSLTKSVFLEAHLLDPANKDVLDYIEIMDAKSLLKRGSGDIGESQLKAIIRRSPNNFHAHFILGAHLFWVDKKASLALPHLETCVRLAPNFLRAWGCLGAIYKELGSPQLAASAFRKCLDLETDPKMREFFQRFQ